MKGIPLFQSSISPLRTPRSFGGISVALSIVLIVFGIVSIILQILAQKSAMLRRVTFLNQLVHEIKTPLTGLKLHAQLIQSNGITPISQQAILQSVDRLNRVFDQIVLINNQETYSSEIVEMNPQQLHQIFDRLDQQFKQKLTLNGKFHWSIYCDASRLEIVLRNLIENGVKYGGHVDVGIQEESGITTIAVKDHGPGIGKRESRKIFREFYQTSSARSSSVDGLGIGLSIVRSLCQQMGAMVTLKNPGEPKACFLVQLKNRKTSGDKVRGLDLGADDYVVKPFDLKELMARVRKYAKRQGDSDAKFHGFQYDWETRELTDPNGKFVTLSSKERVLLEFFMKRANRIVTREQILDAVWGSDYMGTDRTVDNLILSLRKKPKSIVF